MENEKKVYNKPTVSVEVLEMDRPIAGNCSANSQDMSDLTGFGYFSADNGCEKSVDDIAWGNDTICYHSNVILAFLS